jgi:hypothetical protein
MMMMMVINFPWVSFGEALGQSFSKSVWLKLQKCGCGTAKNVLGAQGRKQFFYVCVKRLLSEIPQSWSQSKEAYFVAQINHFVSHVP